LNAERLEELLILNRPNRPGEDVKDSVLPHSYKQEWWEWERTKHEFQNMGSVAGSESFVDENEAVNRILQVVCRDEIAMGITYKQAKDTDAHKMAEPPKGEERKSLMPIPRHSALNASYTLWRALHLSTQGTFCRRRCSENRGFLHSLRAMIVSPFHLSWDYKCFGWFFVLFAFLGGGFCCCVLFGLLTGFPDF